MAGIRKRLGPNDLLTELCQKMFIVTEYGVPHVTKELRAYRPDCLSAMKISWSHCKAFDAESRYEPKPNGMPSFSVLQRILAHTIYNPSSRIQVDWQVAGESSLAEIIAEVEKGLEKDDDIIQQWFGADDVLKLLRSACTFDEMLDRVECLCGGFELDDRLREIVDDVLGKQ